VKNNVINQVYIDGEFITPHGTELFDLHNPATGQVIGQVQLAVGTAITRHRDIAKISFTGSTVIGKTILREAVDTLKRVTLELGGKSPSIILDDADLTTAMPFAHHRTGRVLINLAREPLSPFGGFKQSGIGREYGSYGLEAFLEPRAVTA
jgi:acyl-CoA reductase-like NAD-dependent aldehyde dehydrogenase